MNIPVRKTQLSIENYLVGDQYKEIKYEYLYGITYLMTDESLNHRKICSNIYNKISEKLNKTENYQIFMGDMKLQVNEEIFYYPDVFVTNDNLDSLYQSRPILIVEVISPTTKRIDYCEKLQIYKQIPELKEYLVVSQDEKFCKLNYQSDDKTWKVKDFDENTKVIKLDSVKVNVMFDEIFCNVEF